MNIHIKGMKPRFSWMGLGAVAFSATALSLLLSAGACSQVDGSRCNPYLSHDECDNAPAVQCVTPAGQGNSYCCMVSSGAVASTVEPGVLWVGDGPGGTIMDSNENCQTSGVTGSEGQTCPLGSPCWTPTGCTGFLPNGSCVPTGAATDDSSTDDSSTDDSSTATTSDAGEGGATTDTTAAVEASPTEEASVEASATSEASTVSDATPGE
jgi:hypothetical protein